MSIPGQFPESLEARFEVLDLLGQGGFGRVVLARDRELDRQVAIKIHAMAADVPDAVERFLQEARVTARVEAPEVVRIYDHGVEPGGEAWIVYEFVPGETLAARLARKVRLPVDLCLDWGQRVAKALQQVHELGVVHRDIKPANLLIRSDGGQEGPVLCDFGLAWEGKDRAVQTQEGLLLGTPSYMPPEVLFGDSPSPAGDQYAWAAVLYEMAYGRKLQPDPEPSSVVEAHRSGRGPDFRTGEVLVPPAFVDALARALDSDPSRRFPDMAAFARGLQARDTRTRASRRPGLGSSAATVAVDSRVLRTTHQRERPRPASSRRRFALSAGVAVLVGLSVLGGVLWTVAEPPTATATAPVASGPSPEHYQAQVRVERTLEDMLRFLDEGAVEAGPQAGYKFDEYIRARLSQFADPFYGTKFQRYADALVAWAPLADATAEGRARLVLHRRWIDSLVSMYEGAFEQAEVPLDLLDSGSQEEILPLLPKIVNGWTNQKERLRELVDRLRSAAPDASAELLHLELVMAVRVVSPHLEPILQELMYRAEEAEDPAAGLAIANSAGGFLSHSGSRQLLTCKFRRESLRAIARRNANADHEPAQLAEALRLVGDLVYRTFDDCPKQLGELELAAVDRILDQVEADLHPRYQKPLDLFVHQYPLQARPPSNTLAIRLERVKAMRARLAGG